MIYLTPNIYMSVFKKYFYFLSSVTFIEIGSKRFEKVEKFKFLGMIVKII
jgi:hypothetical protein